MLPKHFHFHMDKKKLKGSTPLMNCDQTRPKFFGTRAVRGTPSDPFHPIPLPGHPLPIPCLSLLILFRLLPPSPSERPPCAADERLIKRTVAAPDHVQVLMPTGRATQLDDDDGGSKVRVAEARAEVARDLGAA